MVRSRGPYGKSSFPARRTTRILRASNMSTGSRTPFDGQRVAIFEARMAGALADLVARQGGVPIAAPALREIPIENNADARLFVDGLLAGQFDVVIFETGVGVRLLVLSQGSRLSALAWAEALAKTKVVARGPTGGRPARAGCQARLSGPRTEHLARDPHAARRATARSGLASGRAGIRQASTGADRWPGEARRPGDASADLSVGASRGHRSAHRRA